MSQPRFYPVSRPVLRGKELDYVAEAIRSGWISSLGEFVGRFEREFAQFCGVEHAITVSNGTTALHLALHALGIGEGDEVIVPDLSFVASANTVLLTGATPVFCDVEEASLCIDPAQVERLITPRTRAIMPVHLYGQAADMTRLLAIASKHGLRVIEDAAEAHGSEVGERRVGGLGDCATFSFYANKNMTTGEGGMITTNDAALAARCRFLRDHAMSPDKRYWHTEMGFNYRMTNVQAAIGCAQLEQVEGFLAARRALFAAYQERLGDIPGLSLNRSVEGRRSSYWMICAEVSGFVPERRDALCAELRRRGVDSRPYFFPMSMMPHLPNADTPVSKKVSGRGLNLPSYVDLSSSDLDDICGHVRSSLQVVGS